MNDNTRTKARERIAKFVTLRGGALRMSRETEIPRSTIGNWLYRGTLPDLYALLILVEAYGHHEVTSELLQ